MHAVTEIGCACRRRCRPLRAVGTGLGRAIMGSTHRVATARRRTGLLVVLAIVVGTAVAGTSSPVAAAPSTRPHRVERRREGGAHLGDPPGVRRPVVRDGGPVRTGAGHDRRLRSTRPIPGTRRSSTWRTRHATRPVSSSTRSTSCCCDRPTRRGATTAWSTSRRTAATSCRCSSSTARHRPTIRLAPSTPATGS